MKLTKAEVYKIRYQALINAGYSSKEARKLRTQTKTIPIDVNKIKLDSSGEVVKKNNFKCEVRKLQIERYSINFREVGRDPKKTYIVNDRTYTYWGLLTQDKRYRDDTFRTIKRVQRDNKLSHKQASYFVYLMISNGWTYEQTRRYVLTRQEWEMYAKSGDRPPRTYRNKVVIKRKRKRKI